MLKFRLCDITPVQQQDIMKLTSSICELNQKPNISTHIKVKSVRHNQNDMESSMDRDLYKLGNGQERIDRDSNTYG